MTMGRSCESEVRMKVCPHSFKGIFLLNLWSEMSEKCPGTPGIDPPIAILDSCTDKNRNLGVCLIAEDACASRPAVRVFYFIFISCTIGSLCFCEHFNYVLAGPEHKQFSF